MATAIVSGVALALLVIACSPPETEVERQLESARAARAAGDHASAVVAYRRILEEDPSHVEAHYELGLSFLDLGRGKAALWELRETVRLAPENLDARLSFAWLAVAAHYADDALEQANAILERDPENLDAKLVRAAALLEQGELEESGAQGEAILEQRPAEKRAHYHMAHVRSAQGRLDEAEYHLLRYRELDGRSAAATREVLSFYRATGQSHDAEVFLERTIPDAAPADRADLALALAALLEREERLPESEPFLRQALAADEARLDVRERLALLMMDDGRGDEALALMEDVALPGRPDATVYRIRGDLLMKAERFDAALAAYRAGLAIDADAEGLRLREAESLLRVGDLEASSERILALMAENPGDPMVALAHVRSLALASRTEEAIVSLNELLAGDPKIPAAHFLLGVLQLAMDRPAEAARSLDVATVGMSGKRALQAQRLLAEAQLRSGDFASSAENAERALGADPGDTRSRIVLARAVLEMGASERAKALLHEAPSESAGVHAALARVYVKTEQPDLARMEMQRAHALEPDSVQWTVDLVWLLTQHGKLDEALEIARTSVIENPDVPDYTNLLGQVLVEREDFTGARRVFNQAVEADPDFVPGYVNLARLSMRAQRHGEAREILQRVLARRPEDPDALRELGLVEYLGGNPKAAAAAFEAASRADPSSGLTRSNLARAQAEAGDDLSDALQIARTVRQSDPDNPEYAETLGLVLYRSGLYAPAAAQFRDAIANAPHPIAVYHYRLGLALVASGDVRDAKIEFERSLELDSSFKGAEDARRRLADLASGTGQPDQPR